MKYTAPAILLSLSILLGDSTKPSIGFVPGPTAGRVKKRINFHHDGIIQTPSTFLSFSTPPTSGHNENLSGGIFFDGPTDFKSNANQPSSLAKIQPGDKDPQGAIKQERLCSSSIL